MQPGHIRLPINSFSWLLWRRLVISRGLWHGYLVPDVFSQCFWHLERGERWDELALAAFTTAPLHASSRAVFGTRQRKEKTNPRKCILFRFFFRYLAHICGRRPLVQKETIRLYGHLLEDISMCSAAGATRWVTVHVRPGKENTHASPDACNNLVANAAV